MIGEEKRQLIVSFTKFYMLYRKELLDLTAGINPALSPLLSKTLFEIYLNEDITPSMLSKRLAITIPNTSRCLYTLANSGYITKVKNQTDNRKTHLRLSEEGHALVENSLDAVFKIMSDKLGALETSDLIKLSDAVSILKGLFKDAK